MVYGSPLISDGGRRRTVHSAEERQVIAHDIDRDGREHEKQTDPNTPITMRTSPVRTMVMMHSVALRPFVSGVTVVTLAHWFSFSIAALYSPRRADRLHLCL